VKFERDQILKEINNHSSIASLARSFQTSPFMMRYELGKMRLLDQVKLVLKQNNSIKKESCLKK